MRAATLLLAALAAGCVARGVVVEAPPSADPATDAELMLECDRARVVVPERLRGEFEAPSTLRAGPANTLLAGGVRVTVREGRPVVEIGGEDFSVVAEGIVWVRRRNGRSTVEEGPYRTVILRNGDILRR